MEENSETSDDITDYYGSLIVREGEDIMDDSFVTKVTEDFVQEIMKTEIYKEYDFQKRKLKEQPELFEKVREFRQKNFAMQTADAQGDELLEKLETFEREVEKLRDDPVVDRFLSAELAFCRMMQEVNVLIMAGLDFE